MKSNNRYLYGLDISLKNTGVSVYDLDEHKFVYIGSFSTEKIYATKQYKGLHLNAVKLIKIAEWMRVIIKEYPPYIVAIERMFARFKNETISIAKATGVIQALFWKYPQYLYAPKKVKATIYHGNASKDSIAEEILKRYDLEINNDDESDAVAVALTLLIENGLIEWEKSELPKKTTRKKAKKK